MTTLLSRLLPFLLLLAAALPAQGLHVCLSVHGVAAGVDSVGAPSRLTASIGGVATTILPAAGSPGPVVSAAHEAAFVAAGYMTVRINPNEFCITAVPGGGPVVAGAAYGTTDLGLGLDNKIRRIPGPQPIVAPLAKANGAGLALPAPVAAPQPVGAQFAVYVFVRIGGFSVSICVQINLQAGLTGLQIQDAIQWQLELQGFFGQRVVIGDPLVPGALLDVLQLERTASGDVIEGVELDWDPGARLLLPTVICCGQEPVFGAWEYGVATQNFAIAEPWSQCLGDPSVGGFFEIVHETQYPFGLCIDAIALGQPPFGVDVFGGTLLVDPATMVLEAGLTDPLGTFSRPWLIPPAPQLAGLELASQAVVLDPSDQFTFTTGVGVKLKP